jgi:hypothetical protein
MTARLWVSNHNLPRTKSNLSMDGPSWLPFDDKFTNDVSIAKCWMRGWDSNPRMEVLQFGGRELSYSFSWVISSVLTALVCCFWHIPLADC